MNIHWMRKAFVPVLLTGLVLSGCAEKEENVQRRRRAGAQLKEVEKVEKIQQQIVVDEAQPAQPEQPQALVDQKAEAAELQKELEAELKAQESAKKLADEMDSKRENERNQKLAELEAAGQEKKKQIAESTVLKGNELSMSDQQMAILVSESEKFVQKGEKLKNKTNIVPSALHRLADLYVVQENSRFQEQLTDFEIQTKECETNPKVKCPDDVPLKDYDKAIKAYNRLLTEFPTRRDNDRVLYMLSFCYQEMAMVGAAEKVLNDFIKQYPKDPRTQTAYFRLGELYFTNAVGMDLFEARPWLEKAATAYTKATEFDPDSEYYDRSLYKLGWTYFRMGRYDTTVEYMAKLVESRSAIDIQKKKKYKNFDELYENDTGLVREAVQYMAVAFTEQGDGKSGAKNLEDYWTRRKTQPYEQYTYISLGEYLANEERYDEAITVYQKLLAKYPTYHRSPNVYELIMSTYEKDKKWDKVVETRKQLIVQLEPNGQWWNANQKDKETIGLAVKIRGKAILQMAQYHHAKATHPKTAAADKPKNFEEAENYYTQYLKEYPNTPEAADAGYMIAEVYVARENMPAAAEKYYNVAWVQQLPERQEKAGLKAISAYNDSLEADLKRIEEDRKAKAQKYTRKIGLLQSQYTDKLLDSIQKFSAKYPAHEKTLDILVLAGAVQFDSENWTASRDVFKRIIKDFPNDKRSLMPKRYLATTYMEAGMLKEAEEAYRDAAKDNRWSAQERNDLLTLQTATIYKRAEALHEKREYLEAAAMFMRVPNESPQSDIAVKAFFKSATEYRSAEQYDKMIQTFSDMAARYPKSEEAAAGYVTIGEYYKDTKQLDKAAAQYCRASNLFEGQNKRTDAEELQYACGKTYEDLKDWPNTQNAFQNYLRRFKGTNASRTLYATFVDGLIYYDRKDYDNSDKVFNLVVARHKELKKTNPTVTDELPARARFLQADRRFDDFTNIKLGLPLKKSFKRKQAALTELLELYAGSAQYRVPEYVTASSHRIGMALLNFRNSILSSEIPKEVLVDELMVEEYKLQLEEQSFQFEEKAIETFERNLNYGQQNVYLNDWINKSIDELAKIVPAKYARPELGLMLFCDEYAYKNYKDIKPFSDQETRDAKKKADKDFEERLKRDEEAAEIRKKKEAEEKASQPAQPEPAAKTPPGKQPPAGKKK